MKAHAKHQPAAREAWKLLYTLMMRQRGRYPEMAAEFELSPSQAHILLRLKPSNPLPMNELAESLSCDRSNVTGLVDRLETRQLIKREDSDTDRRVTMLVLTTRGERLRGQLKDKLYEPPAALRALSQSEQETLARLLTKIQD